MNERTQFLAAGFVCGMVLPHIMPVVRGYGERPPTCPDHSDWIRIWCGYVAHLSSNSWIEMFNNPYQTITFYGKRPTQSRLPLLWGKIDPTTKPYSFLLLL